MRRVLDINGLESEIWLSNDGSGYTLHEGVRALRCALRPVGGKSTFTLDLEGRRIAVRLAMGNGVTFIHLNGRAHEVGRIDPADRLTGEGAAAGEDRVVAPMPGIVISIAAKPGDKVREGQPLLVIESMKLETTLTAPRDGTLAEIAFGPGDSFGLKAVLAQLLPQEH